MFGSPHFFEVFSIPTLPFGRPWRRFGTSFSTLMGGSRCSATVAQAFQSRDVTDLRLQITAYTSMSSCETYMLYDHRTRLAIFDMPLAQKRRNSSIGYGVRSSHPTIRGDFLRKEALTFVDRICSAFKRHFLRLQYTHVANSLF